MNTTTEVQSRVYLDRVIQDNSSFTIVIGVSVVYGRVHVLKSGAFPVILGHVFFVLHSCTSAATVKTQKVLLLSFQHMHQIF